VPRLQTLRIARLLTQQQLAEAAGVSPHTIVRLEREGARAELRTIARLATALGVTAAELMGHGEKA
jgi:transcriptional regulator with XRE-family HTH domain